nr:HipA N-terminal domain-containing protein [Stutzerimonas chloritidismutans]
MECPETGETVTLGRLTLAGGTGTFVYAPEIVEAKRWVPDPIRYPLSTRPIQVHKNGGVPGFIDDAMPDGLGGTPVAPHPKGRAHSDPAPAVIS